MVKSALIFCMLFCSGFALRGATYLQFEDLDTGQRGYWKLADEGGVISNLSPLMLGSDTAVGEAAFYSGYVIKYEHETEGLSLVLHGNDFEGFLELAPGQFTPVLRLYQSTAVIPEAGDDWTLLRFENRKPFRLRVVEMEREPAGLQLSE